MSQRKWEKMMEKLSKLVAVLGLSVVFGLSACSNNNNETSQTAETTTASEVALPTKDRGGEEIEIPEEVDKMVSLVPSVTQVIDDLGCKDQLVAVDTQSPAMTEELDELPQIDMMAVDAETLISLNPQVIYVSDISLHGSENVWSQVKDAGITVVNIPTSNTIEDIALDVQFIADTLQEHEKGQELVDTMNKEIDEIKEIGATITDKKKVLFEISALPEIYSFGQGVYLNEMIELVGAENVLADQESWIPVTEEAAIASKPDVILTNVNYLDDAVHEILDRGSWKDVPAVKNEAVFYIDNAASSLPNHHMTKALKEMALAIYPDEYKSLENE